MNTALARRRELRAASTDAEAALWRRLRAKRFGGLKFRRQYPCGPYILDFYCPQMRLAIELDGGQHFTAEAQAYDDRRTEFLCRGGISVLRFPTDLVFREPEAVMEVIAQTLGLVESPRPWAPDPGSGSSPRPAKRGQAGARRAPGEGPRRRDHKASAV